jgi:hypothetical protein
MFANWIKILPYFVVVSLAKLYSERFAMRYADGTTVHGVMPFASGEVITWKTSDENDSFSE